MPLPGTGTAMRPAAVPGVILQVRRQRAGERKASLVRHGMVIAAAVRQQAPLGFGLGITHASILPHRPASPELSMPGDARATDFGC